MKSNKEKEVKKENNKKEYKKKDKYRLIPFIW